VFLLLFLVEALVKLQTFGRKGYFASPWNVFDFIIVVASLPSFFAFLSIVPDYSVLLLLRLFRLVRLVRFMEFVPNLKQLLVGLGRAFKASVFVLMALMGYNFILAIFTCHAYGNIAPNYFGDPFLSAYTIFQLFTVEGWNEIPKQIIENSAGDAAFGYWQAGLLKLYIVLVVLTGGIFGMSLANAVFVDEMTIDNNEQLEHKITALEKQIQKLTQLIENKVLDR
jgi:voltage-gated sodium channel